MIRVAIVDDHAMFVSGLIAVLGRESDFNVVATYATGEQALADLDDRNVDIVLVDVNLPDIVGIQLAHRLQKKNPELGIVFLTMFSQQQTFGSRRLAPNTRFVSKDEDVPILLKSIRELAQAMPEPAYVEISDSKDDDAPAVALPLTEREQEILDLYRQDNNLVQIAAKLDIRKNTVATHLKNIREKLGINTNEPLR